MPTTHKAAASRINAQRSTGPRTTAGKAKAARNAERHGLAIPVATDSSFSAEIRTLAHRILTSLGGGASLELALRVAEAQIELDRVRLVRHRLINHALADPSARGKAGTSHTAKLVARLRRQDPDDQSRPANTVGAQDAPALETASEPAPAHEAQLLAELTRELTALDRYERRALSRRKFAIRALDQSRMGCL